MRTWHTAIAMTVVTALTVACTAQARSPEPVPVDRVECARCRMLISSESGGGQIVSPSEETRFYDDVRCLAADWTNHRTGAHAFVGLGGGRWIDATVASFARPTDARTAMASGLVAFATLDEARAADPGGGVLSFDDVVRVNGGPR